MVQGKLTCPWIPAQREEVSVSRNREPLQLSIVRQGKRLPSRASIVTSADWTCINSSVTYPTPK